MSFFDKFIYSVSLAVAVAGLLWTLAAHPVRTLEDDDEV